MDLKSGYPFWPAKNGLIHTYNPLDRSLTTDVAIIGGGITGALIAHAVVESGRSCVVLDRRNLGWGSTAASTALLQYEIDTHLVDLCNLIGEQPAFLAYRTCWEALHKAEAICQLVGAGDYVRKESFYFASRRRDVTALKQEHDLRSKLGLEIEWWTAPEIAQRFDFPAEGGLFSRDAAELDAYQLAHALFRRIEEKGAGLFARTKIESAAEHDQGVVLTTATGHTVTAGYAVIAGGYESPAFLKQPVPVKFNSTFAFATEPLPHFEGWYRRCLLWETARPYVYARTTADGRGILGGEDLPFKNEALRDRCLPRQIARLAARWKRLFPRIPMEIAYPWTGTFGETPDGLPYIGFPPAQPRTFVAMCYGGNGITYSVIAAEMLVEALAGRRHPCADLFGLERNRL